MSEMRIRVLHLEDNVYDGELVQACLSADGLRADIHRVATEVEFLNALKTGEFDIILSDYSLPAYDGAAALTAALKIRHDTPFIFVTGALGEERAVETLKQGATDYVLKGNLARLGPSVRRAISELCERNRRRRAEEELRRLNTELEERVQIRTQELMNKNVQLEGELRIARELQFAMLPQTFPTIPEGVAPEHSALRFLSYYRPAGGVSGDFFDIIRVSGTSVGLLLCDVMGHDVRAALVTGMLRAIAEEFAPKVTRPGALLGHINRSLATILKKADTTLFVTAFYLVADVARHEILYSNAGHPAPLWVHRTRAEVEVVHTGPETGPALGLLPDAVYGTCSKSMEMGDSVMMFTDGLFDIEDPETHEAFCQERLFQAAQRRVTLPARDLFHGLLHDVRHFAGAGDFDDDVCLLGLEINAQ